MANQLSPLIPKLLAQGLLALRQNSIMPRLVNRGYDELAGEKGSTITIPVSSAIAAQAVTPANTPPTTADTAPTSVTLTMSNWYEAPFYLTDKDLLEVDRGVIPMQAAEAVKSLCNQADNDILGLWPQIYNAVGTPGQAPFATDVSTYLQARKKLNNALAPLEPRYAVINADAEANALGLRAFEDLSFSGSIDGIVNGQINRKIGASWLLDQNLPTACNPGTANGAYLVNNGAGYPIGTTVMTVDTGAGTLLAGALFTVAGDNQQQTVVSTVGGGTVTQITFQPGLSAAVLDNAQITVVASHALNLLLHRDALAFASRPFAGADPMNLGNFLSAVDPISGLTLRLEVTREYKRTRWAFDILYGVAAPRPQLAARIMG